MTAQSAYTLIIFCCFNFFYSSLHFLFLIVLLFQSNFNSWSLDCWISLHTFAPQEAKGNRKCVVRWSRPTCTHLLSSFKKAWRLCSLVSWNGSGPFALTRLMDCFWIKDPQSHHWLCFLFVSPCISSVSMQFSSSNSSRDAHERNWSAKGSCHVSLCFKAFNVNCLYKLLYTVASATRDALPFESKVLILSW